MADIKHKGLTSNLLKIIAIIAMFLDHAASGLMPPDSTLGALFHICGRMTAPIMCYFIAEGYYHTHDILKYIKRLFLFAVLSHFPYDLYFKLNYLKATGVMWALLLGLIALCAYKSDKINNLYKVAIIFVCCALAVPANWNYIAVLWVLGFGAFHGDIRKQMLAFTGVSVFHMVLTLTNPHIQNPWYQLGIFLAVPLILLYNGQRGKNIKALKWGFYLFYPIHLVVLYCIRYWIESLGG